MATKSENADIRELQTRMKRVEDDITEVKSDVKAVLSRLDNLEDIFVTRREFSVVKWLIGVGFTLAGLAIAFLDKLGK